MPPELCRRCQNPTIPGLDASLCRKCGWLENRTVQEQVEVASKKRRRSKKDAAA